MASLADQIEKYLRKLLTKYEGEVEIKRNQLASDFDCVPSQINYVLNTRFTVEKGYLVESQRGGGGYIRIIRVSLDSNRKTLKELISRIDGPITQREAEGIIDRLFDNNFITEKERDIMKVAVNRKYINVELPHRDYIRSRLLRGMLKTIIKHEDEEG
ncbi:CtsR family transcriptional regulator [Halothermothrix orenii]|uniref:Transcriptional regulator CtsR n=1 Tax=Halothermothrix orenii (strain H 168 / OCM 544 / DSM 9562) TaxID=373903 RepID=B8D091_HALOH|nr:CtsR family transcriptional regulator [Halothermothrix orenii]ACL68845.1 transcriptional repressor, CtsR [Halothermothrix orenii H 168]